MTYNVFGETLSLTHSINQSVQQGCGVGVEVHVLAPSPSLHACAILWLYNEPSTLPCTFYYENLEFPPSHPEVRNQYVTQYVLQSRVIVWFWVRSRSLRVFSGWSWSPTKIWTLHPRIILHWYWQQIHNQQQTTHTLIIKTNINRVTNKLATLVKTFHIEIYTNVS